MDQTAPSFRAGLKNVISFIFTDIKIMAVGVNDVTNNQNYVTHSLIYNLIFAL